MYKDQAQVLF